MQFIYLFIYSVFAKLLYASAYFLIPTLRYSSCGPIPTQSSQTSTKRKLDQFMQKAGDEGVILVSFGTVVEQMDEASLQMMATAFSRLPQKIIWKLKLKGMSTDTV